MILRISPDAAAFHARGFALREYFPHRLAVIRKQYPDTFFLMEGRGVDRVESAGAQYYQLNLYSDRVDGLPEELFTDRAVNWHGQQFGQKGLIAAAGIWLQSGVMRISVVQSDLCQQLYRHAELKRTCKTQVEKRFGYWYRMLFNAVLDFAMDMQCSAVRTPTADWMIGATKKQIQPDLFRRIYDAPENFYLCKRVKDGAAEYWEIGVAENRDRVVRLEREDFREPATRKQICIFHDTEENVDTDISAEDCRRNLTAMLAMEQAAVARATYTVVGNLLKAKRDEIWGADPWHALGFHSFNHDLEDLDQLRQCRRVDHQVRGYRPPRSVITPELTDDSLSYYNFEWLACGARSLGCDVCGVRNGIVRIPIFTDDYPLVTGKVGFEEWSGQLLERAQAADFLAFGLHDCYASQWLSAYPRLLERLGEIGEFVSADDVCDRMFWRSAGLG